MSDSKTIQQRAEEQLVELEKDIEHYLKTLMLPEQKKRFEEMDFVDQVEHIRNRISNFTRLETKILSKWNLEKII